MRPFDAAWAVLKEDIQLTPGSRAYIGEGAFRSTYANPATQGEVVKVGNKAGFNMANIAASNALAQLGYPVAPETPVMVDWQSTLDQNPRRMMAVTQQRAPQTAGGRLKTLQASEKEKNKFIDEYDDFRDELTRRDRLTDTIGLRDVRLANVGMFDDGMKTIDFETGLGSYGEPRYDGTGRAHHWPNIAEWLDVPDEQRRAFINLYGDRSIFEPWDEARSQPFGLDSGEDLYRRNARNLEFMSDVIDNPEQRRLFEFIDEGLDERSKTFGQKAGMERWREKVMQHRRNAQ